MLLSVIQYLNNVTILLGPALNLSSLQWCMLSCPRVLSIDGNRSAVGIKVLSIFSYSPMVGIIHAITQQISCCENIGFASGS